MLELFEETPIVSSVLLLFLLAIALIISDAIFHTDKPFEGIIMDKHYKSEENSTGTGTTINSDGNIGIITTSSHSDEKFLLIIKTIDGQYKTAESTPETYYTKKVGDKISGAEHIGKILGICWETYVND